jgi:ribose transport system permease protein
MKRSRTDFIKGFKNEFQENPILPIFCLAFIVACLSIPNFATAYNLKNFLLQTSDVLILACGVTFVVLNGGIDFSVTSTLTLGSVVGAYIMAMSPIAKYPILSIMVAMMVMLMIGVIVGLINGLAVSRLKIPSFIATLATQLAFSGIAVLFTSIVTDKPSIAGLPDAFFIIGGEGKFFFVPIVISLCIWGLSYWMLKYTNFGRKLYAMGVNPKTAYISGMPVKDTILKIMVLSGLYAGIASILATSRNQVGVSSLGDKMFITIIACVIVGGTKISGGFGGVKQTLFGVLFITLLNNTMNLLGVEWYIIMLEQGVLILLAAVLGFLLNKQQRVL